MQFPPISQVINNRIEFALRFGMKSKELHYYFWFCKRNRLKFYDYPNRIMMVIEAFFYNYTTYYKYDVNLAIKMKYELIKLYDFLEVWPNPATNLAIRIPNTCIIPRQQLNVPLLSQNTQTPIVQAIPIALLDVQNSSIDIESIDCMRDIFQEKATSDASKTLLNSENHSKNFVQHVEMGSSTTIVCDSIKITRLKIEAIIKKKKIWETLEDFAVKKKYKQLEEYLTSLN